MKMKIFDSKEHINNVSQWIGKSTFADSQSCRLIQVACLSSLDQVHRPIYLVSLRDSPL